MNLPDHVLDTIEAEARTLAELVREAADDVEDAGVCWDARV